MATMPDIDPNDPIAVKQAALAALQGSEPNLGGDDSILKAALAHDAALSRSERLSNAAQQWAAFPVTKSAPQLEGMGAAESEAGQIGARRQGLMASLGLAGKLREEQLSRAEAEYQLRDYLRAAQDPQYKGTLVDDTARIRATMKANPGEQPTPEAIAAERATMEGMDLPMLTRMAAQAKAASGDVAGLGKTKGDTAQALGAGAASQAKALQDAAMTPAMLAEKYAGAKKSLAEAGAIPAGTAKTEAETKKILQDIGSGGEIAPGFIQTGPMSDGEREAFRAKVGAVNGMSSNIDEIEKITQGKDFLASPTKRALVAPRIAKLLLDVKAEAAAKGMSPGTMAFMDNMIGDPTKLSPATLFGLAHDKERMGALRSVMNEDLDRHPSITRVRRVPGAKAEDAKPAGAPVGTKKTANGVTYEKRADGWHEVPHG